MIVGTKCGFYSFFLSFGSGICLGLLFHFIKTYYFKTRHRELQTAVKVVPRFLGQGVTLEFWNCDVSGSDFRKIVKSRSRI